MPPPASRGTSLGNKRVASARSVNPLRVSTNPLGIIELFLPPTKPPKRSSAGGGLGGRQCRPDLPARIEPAYGHFGDGPAHHAMEGMFARGDGEQGELAALPARNRKDFRLLGHERSCPAVRRIF